LSIGYVYVLSNLSMPGLLKIGRTDRRPETRAKELASSTGVPSEFKIEFSTLVSDSIAAERFVHQALEKKGCRHAQNREFFSAPLDEVIELVRQVSVQVLGSSDEIQRLASVQYLSHRLDRITRPGHYDRIDLRTADGLEAQLLPIAREGYDYAFSVLAHIFLENYPTSLKYRQYALDHLDTKFARIKSEWSRSSMSTRQEIGQNLANFLENLYQKKWLGEHDFETVQRFLVSADGYTYEGFVQAVKRSEFPDAIRERSLNL
jgi:hypothetical protein